MPGIRRQGAADEQSIGSAVAYNVEGGIPRPSRLWISWSNGSRLQLSYLKNEGEGKVSEVHLGQEWSAERRRIAYESLPAFALLQNQKQQNSSDWWENVLEYSMSIGTVLDSQQDGKTVTMKAIWELIEVFYVDRGAASWLPERLADWLANYDKVLSSEEDNIHSKLLRIQQELPAIQFPEDEPAYWDAMTSALSVGWLDTVISFLRMHGSYRLDHLDNRETENGLVEAITVLISKMPRLRPRLPDGAPGVAISFKPDFSKAWDKWRSQVSALDNSVYWAECNHRGTLVGLKKMIQVLLGNVDVLALCTYHWVELLVAHFLYVIPFSLVSDGMRGVAAKCKQLKDSGDDDSHQLLSSIISNDTEILLAKCSKIFDSWMMAHVGELLSAKGKDAQSLLDEERESLGGLSLQELHRLVYAQVLSSHSLTWQLAPVYLASCPKQGLGMLEAILLRQGCGNQKTALKALELCRLYGLENVGTAIGRAVGVHNLKHGKQGLAIMWLQWARDEFRLSAIADQFLKSVTSGEADQLQNLENIEGLLDIGTIKYEGLSFLARYKSFKTSLQCIGVERRKEPGTEKVTALGRKAVDSLLELFKSGTFSRRFWLSLLEDSVVLLDWPEQVLITEAETNALLCCLEEVFVAKDRGDLDVLQQSAEPNVVDKVRLALAKNLGRAILQGV